jgi:hypothetical protein
MEDLIQKWGNYDPDCCFAIYYETNRDAEHWEQVGTVDST